VLTRDEAPAATAATARIKINFHGCSKIVEQKHTEKLNSKGIKKSMRKGQAGALFGHRSELRQPGFHDQKPHDQAAKIINSACDTAAVETSNRTNLPPLVAPA
jgi:hypothetical protein